MGVSCTRDQFEKVRAMLGQQAVCIAQIAKETGLTRQTSTESRVTLRVLIHARLIAVLVEPPTPDRFVEFSNRAFQKVP
jgi:hypothetical protein